jgi:hypothetical protein
MKAVILAGGIGSRLSEETTLRPKPMVEVGGKPILWHIMKTYAAYGIQDFVICLGYKGYAIKEYFANYVLHMSDVTIDLEHNNVELHEPRRELACDPGRHGRGDDDWRAHQAHPVARKWLLLNGAGPRITCSTRREADFVPSNA